MDALRNARGVLAVIALICSPTRVVLVLDPSFTYSHWKLPGGGIKPTDDTVISAAIRECKEETGILLTRQEVTLFLCQPHESKTRGPYLCIAKVTEKKLDTRYAFGKEETHNIKVAAFRIEKVLTEMDLLQQHRSFIREVLSS